LLTVIQEDARTSPNACVLLTEAYHSGTCSRTMDALRWDQQRVPIEVVCLYIKGPPSFGSYAVERSYGPYGGVGIQSLMR
jgi:hypothetical protein